MPMIPMLRRPSYLLTRKQYTVPMEMWMPLCSRIMEQEWLPKSSTKCFRKCVSFVLLKNYITKMKWFWFFGDHFAERRLYKQRVKLTAYATLYFINWWLVRVTLVVAWWLFPQNFGRWWGPTNHYFAQKWMQLQWWVTCEVVGTLNHYKIVKKFFKLCVLRGGGDKNFSIICSSLALELGLAVLELELVLGVVGT